MCTRNDEKIKGFFFLKKELKSTLLNTFEFPSSPLIYSEEVHHGYFDMSQASSRGQFYSFENICSISRTRNTRADRNLKSFASNSLKILREGYCQPVDAEGSVDLLTRLHISS
jgi:hypothetical protein